MLKVVEGSKKSDLKQVAGAEKDVEEVPGHSEPTASTDSIKAYFNNIKRHPLLTPKEERVVARKIARGDADARTRMIEGNLRLVVNIAKRYIYRGLPLQDLIEEGNIGLIKSVERFKAEKGCKFSTYATYWIRQSVERAIVNQSKIVRMPIHVTSDLAKMMRTTRELKSELKRDPSDKELAENMGVTGRYISKLQTLSRKSYSLDAAINEQSDQSLLDKLEDDKFPLPFDIVDSMKRAELVRGWLTALDPNESMVLRLRFGLDGEPQTLERIGKLFCVTRERIRQIEARALEKLKKIVEENDITSPDAI